MRSGPSAAETAPCLAVPVGSAVGALGAGGFDETERGGERAWAIISRMIAGVGRVEGKLSR